VHACSASFDQRFDCSDFVGGEIVQYHDVAVVQFRTEHVVQIGGKDLGFDRAGD